MVGTGGGVADGERERELAVEGDLGVTGIPSSTRLCCPDASTAAGSGEGDAEKRVMGLVGGPSLYPYATSSKYSGV